MSWQAVSALAEQKRSRPAVARGNGTNDQVGAGSIPSLHDTLGADDIATHIDGTFVLLVKTTHGRYRRRCFMSVKAAENAARRATDAGHNATVVLAELRPVYRLAGGDAR